MAAVKQAIEVKSIYQYGIANMALYKIGIHRVRFKRSSGKERYALGVLWASLYELGASRSALRPHKTTQQVVRGAPP